MWMARVVGGAVDRLSSGALQMVREREYLYRLFNSLRNTLYQHIIQLLSRSVRRNKGIGEIRYRDRTCYLCFV